MNYRETEQQFQKFNDWLGVRYKGADPTHWSRFKWLAVLGGYHWCTGDYLPVGLVPQFIEYQKERRIMDIIKRGDPAKRGDIIPDYRHSPVSNGHVYCPEEACEYPVMVTQDGSAYCQGCSAYVGEEECEERELSILVKESDGTLKRVVL